ncbi:MAG: hypothetical protein H6744_04015 [Deltaproteobacteria bacterium]|nr:hypothetical protein [Deltaproteobacteria bacterium]MCB9785843.1 hypothetical protein [Deltaproteobacteria bacterium]
MRAGFGRVMLAACLLAVGVTGPGCGDDGVLLPSNINTLKFRNIAVAPTQKAEAPVDVVRPLNGILGAPVPVVPGDASLKTAYWGRLANSPEDDGAHVGMVRLGTDTTCGVSLESVFPNASADVSKPASYDFSKLDAHVQAIKDLNTATVLWQAAFNPGAGGQCEASVRGVQQGAVIQPGVEGERWAQVAANTLRHLNGGTTWDPAGHSYGIRYVEFMDDPYERMGYTEDQLVGLFSIYKRFAGLVKAQFPDDATAGPAVRVGGISFTLESVDDLSYTVAAEKHGILRFIDFCATEGVPLDFLSFRTRTRQPFEAYAIAAELRRYLDEQPADTSGRLQRTQLIAAGVVFDRDNPELLARGILAEPILESTYLGAFQAAARIFMQEVPVDHMIAGRGPRVFQDLATHSGTDPASLTDLIVNSLYFDADGRAQPAFMSLFPFRQVAGHQRVRVITGADGEGMAIMASHDRSSDRVLHVIIANANVLTGEGGLNADITYDLRLDNFVPATVPLIGYKLAVIDRGSVGVDSFHFSETGLLETIRSPTQTTTAQVSFVHQMAVPAIHYIQFSIEFLP